MKDLMLIESNGEVDLAYDEAAHDFVVDESLLNNIIMSIHIAAGTYFHAPEFGLKKASDRLSQETSRRYTDAIKSALKWIVDSGRASCIEVTVERDDTRVGWLIAFIKARKSDKIDVDYTTFLRVI